MVSTTSESARPAAKARLLVAFLRLAGCVVVIAAYVLMLAMHPSREAPSGPKRSAVDAASAAMYRACQQALQDQDWAKAAGLASKLRTTYPESDIYARVLAKAYHGLKRYDEEARVWESYMLIAPTPVDACPSVGNAWQKAGNSTKALQAFKRCWQLEPQNSDGIFNYALALERSGNSAEAATLYRAGLAQAPNNYDLSVGLGRVILRAGDAAEARRLAEQVLAARPEYSDALLLFGAALLKLNDREGAKAALRRGIEVSPRYVDIYLALGRILEDEKKNAEALDLYRKAAEIDPSRDDVQRRILRLQVTP
jgi:Putative Zn-dependent protease, contains TPR repeats